MSDLVRGRYAPSPTGSLHLGNLRTALLAWLFARCAQGTFVLRVEDLDRPRVRSGATAAMLDDLHWLGLDWDEGPDCGGPYVPYTQSERLAIYEDFLQRLVTADLVYPCYCSRAEIARIASAPHGDEGPIYPGTCRQLTIARRRQLEAEGKRPSLRLRVNEASTLTFTDLLAGPITQNVAHTVGDFILRRSDGIFSYQFAVVVDDGLMHINQVVRGLDLLSSTTRQILLFEALNLPIPTYAHVPLWLDSSGHRLSKRLASEGLEPLRSSGLTPETIIGRLAFSCGLLDHEQPISAHDLAQAYTLSTLRSRLCEFAANNNAQS